MTPKQLHEARHTLGLTLDQMARMIGYTGVHARQQMYDMERGERTIRDPQRRLVQAYLSGYRPPDWPLD